MIHLIDRDIRYCRHCMVCRKDDPARAIARCRIEDDMQEIYPIMNEENAYIFGTPVNMGDATKAVNEPL